MSRYRQYEACVCLLLAGPFCQMSLAHTEFEESIPLAVAEALFDFGLGGRFAAYSDILDEFPDFQLPDDFAVLGSLEQSNMMRVALQTDLDDEAAMEALLGSFSDAGWVDMPEFGPVRSDFGFVSASQAMPRYNALCHDDHGQLSYFHRQRTPSNIVVLSISMGFGRNWQSCDELIAQQEMSMARMGQSSQGIVQYMPRLLVPADSNPGNPMGAFIGGGMSSSGNSVESDSSIEIDWEMEEVYRHFAEQIVEQAWTLDSESIGSLTATGTWTRVVEQDVTLITRLDVVNSGEERFDLKLTVQAPGGRSGMLLRSF